MGDHKTLAVLLAAFVAGAAFGADAQAWALSCIHSLYDIETADYSLVDVESAPRPVIDDGWSALRVSGDGRVYVLDSAGMYLDSLYYAEEEGTDQ